MGRQIRRVPMDFDWPLNEVWDGFLLPERLREETCTTCDGSGSSHQAQLLCDLWYGTGSVPFDPASTGSTPWSADDPVIHARARAAIERSPQYFGTGPHAVRREARRLAAHFNGAWSYHLSQDDVDALIEADRLWDLTSSWSREHGWQKIEPRPVVTARQVNTWSLSGLGHDSVNCWVAVRARCEREGQPHLCATCAGEGTTERYPGQRAEEQAWEPVEPPLGDGWQLWETVSEGSPLSPVCESAEALASWMSDVALNPRDWLPYPAAMKFIQAGWAPTMVSTAATGLVSGIEWVGMHADDDPNGVPGTCL